MRAELYPFERGCWGFAFRGILKSVHAQHRAQGPALSAKEGAEARTEDLVDVGALQGGLDGQRPGNTLLVGAGAGRQAQLDPDPSGADGEIPQLVAAGCALRWAGARVRLDLVLHRDVAGHEAPASRSVLAIGE